MSAAMRDAFGKHLVECGEKNSKVVVLDADVSSSTKSSLFQKSFPDRFYNVGVSEANMVGIAAGLATAGFHPVVNAFAIFLVLKGLDQIRNDICYNRLPVVLAGAYAGFSDSYDGASHQAIEDISIMRALPNMEVIVPSDARQAELALDYALTRNGPVYIRLNRNEMPDIQTDEKEFFSCKAIKCKSGDSITIAANGITASEAVAAANLLEKEGITADVFSVPFVKPLDSESIFKSALKTGRLLTIEEHLGAGGFSSSLSEKAFGKGFSFKTDSIYVNDSFGETGSYPELLAKFGISVETIIARAKALLM